MIPDLPINELGEFGELAESKGVAPVPTRRPDLDGRPHKRDRGGYLRLRVLCLGGPRYRCPRVVAAGCCGVAAPGAVKVEAPVALGFGISSAEAAMQASVEADGVIIGSKLMQLVSEGGPQKAGEWLGEVWRETSESDRAGVGERH